MYNISNSEISGMCKEVYITVWKNKISQERSKLKWYSTFKNTINLEDYLCEIKKIKYRQALTKLRISAHCLEIEKGRYYRPVVPRENRLCKFCTQNVCDDECHFLIDCTFHQNDRSDLKNISNAASQLFTTSTSSEKALYLIPDVLLNSNICFFCELF